MGLPLRAVIAVVLLPGTMGVFLPLFVIDPAWRRGIVDPIGLVFVVVGAALLLWCVREFLVVGHGTLAPWWPPKQLVTSGPFRFSRNPMYVAMASITLGWAMTYRSWPILVYAIALISMFHIRILLGEEPTMARLFGATWSTYAARVPRWLGRVNE